MEVHRGLDHLPTFKNAVLTIGSFDGVHHGHRAIIRRLVEKARSIGGESIILTFDPHPRQVVFPNDDSLRLLNTLEEKIALLTDSGLDHLIIAPFTIDFSQINPYKYVDDILIGKIGVDHLVIGYDHKFGLNRDGDIDLLNLYAGQGAFTVEEILKQDVNELHVSSTKIRTYLLSGDLSKANQLLGATYTLTGLVTKGSQIAGSLGYPTANCEIKDKVKLIPASGTYAATAEIDGREYNGMLYIGNSPTLQGLDDTMIEINLFTEISESLYGKQIVIRPEKRFRGDQKFKNKEELLYNISQDKSEVLHYFQSKQAPEITTAVLNFNGIHHLQEYIGSHPQSDDCSVVVIDNASTDQSASYIRDNHPEIGVIEIEHNKGFAQGYNEGTASIGSKYLAIVNSDVRVTDDWLQPIIAQMEGDDRIAAVQPKIRSVSTPEAFEYAGAAGGYIDQLGYPLCRGRILDHVEEDTGQYDDEAEIFWASGAAFVIRTDLFRRADGFDGDFFAHMEEIDLCWRLRNAGYRIMSQPKSIVYHLGGGTLSYDSPRKVYLNLRNNYWMILKNKSIASLLLTLPMRLMMDLAYALLFMLKGKLGHSISALRGMMAGVGGVFTMGSKRRRNKYFYNRYSIGAKRDAEGVVKTWLPISYYILGKKKFEQYR